MLKEGDYIYLSHSSTNFMIPYQKKGSFSSHKGQVEFSENMDYGQVVETNTGERFSLLRPTLIDYMMKVKRRTTIIYPKEAGMIILELGIEPGKRVIEIGSGSGSLGILVSRLIGDEGKLYSFDRNEEHQAIARKNMDKLGRPGVVEFFLRDPVEEGGFGVDEIDSVFIDVPEPWKIIPVAHQAMKNGAHIGTLSPNIEQIQSTADAMRETGFDRIRCLEILTRNIRVEKFKTRPFNRMIGHTGYLLFAEKIQK